MTLALLTIKRTSGHSLASLAVSWVRSRELAKQNTYRKVGILFGGPSCWLSQLRSPLQTHRIYFGLRLSGLPVEIAVANIYEMRVIMWG